MIAGLVFGPTVVRSSGTTDLTLQSTLSSSVSLMDVMIIHCVALFGEDSYSADSIASRVRMNTVVLRY